MNDGNESNVMDMPYHDGGVAWIRARDGDGFYFYFILFLFFCIKFWRFTASFLYWNPFPVPRGKVSCLFSGSAAPPLAPNGTAGAHDIPEASAWNYFTAYREMYMYGTEYGQRRAADSRVALATSS